MRIIRVEGQVSGLGLRLGNRRTVGVLGGGPAAPAQDILAAPTMYQSNQCAYCKKSPQFEGTFRTSKAAPGRSRVVKKVLCIITILRRQIPEPLSGT